MRDGYIPARTTLSLSTRRSGHILIFCVNHVIVTLGSSAGRRFRVSRMRPAGPMIRTLQALLVHGRRHAVHGLGQDFRQSLDLSRVLFNQLRHDAAQGLDAQGERRDVEQEDVFNIAFEHGALDRGSHGHDSGLVTAWRLAICPTTLSPLLVTATIDGVVRPPSGLLIIVASPPCMIETQEFVVPRSIPIIWFILVSFLVLEYYIIKNIKSKK